MAYKEIFAVMLFGLVVHWLSADFKEKYTNWFVNSSIYVKGAISVIVSVEFLNCITDVREITFNALSCDNSVIKASVIPSAKYSCSGSFERFVRGNTAME